MQGFEKENEMTGFNRYSVSALDNEDMPFSQSIKVLCASAEATIKELYTSTDVVYMCTRMLEKPVELNGSLYRMHQLIAYLPQRQKANL